jgi:hypothetical protein
MNQADAPSDGSRPVPRGSGLPRPRGTLDVADAWLLALALAAGLWVVLMALFPGLPGIPCMLKATTGFDCPGCGLTRACVAFARGDVQKAIAFNAMSPFVVGYAGVRITRALSRWWLGRTLPPPLPRPVAALLVAAFVAVFVFVAGQRLLVIWAHLVG